VARGWDFWTETRLWERECIRRIHEAENNEVARQKIPPPSGLEGIAATGFVTQQHSFQRTARRFLAKTPQKAGWHGQ